MSRILRSALAALAACTMALPQLSAQSADHHQLSDAWWTGPMLANSAATLPRGHVLVEPYLYDVETRETFDEAGARRSTAPSHGLGSLTYIIYGLTDRLALGAVPTFGYTVAPHGANSSRIGVGDVSTLLQYGLTRFRGESSTPATAIAVEETFPTGKYDRLGDRMSDGFGSGAYATTLSFYSQDYFWLPTGRLLRMRFDASQTISARATVQDASVYGTESGFRGLAKPGASSFLDLSSEYSVSRSWVLALDVTYRHGANTSVSGYDVLAASGAPRAIELRSGASDAVGLAPAVEYSWSSRAGVLLGARIIAAGRNTAASITPAVGVNLVH